MTKVSAIVSAYYAEMYLSGRIDNLLDQSLTPEVIVICQADSKEELIAGQYEGVKIITTDNIPPVYEAWNIGIKQASGEYITTANSDDRLYDNALLTLADVLDKNPKYALAYGNQDIVTEIDAESKERFEWAEGGIKELIETGCFVGPMPMWRKSLHEKYGYFLESEILRNGEEYKYLVASDYEFWMRLAQGGELFYHQRGKSIGKYLKSNNGREHREKNRTIWETARVRSKYR
jgi:glycosyltransferase involved in cell wall biosynthesis